jgi:superfamily I DNA and/or RNA helicase
LALVRNNPERNVGAAGTLQDLNVAISRSKEKLIILGNFDMMLNGWTTSSSLNHRKSPARNLARLVETEYGKIIDAPGVLAI